MADTNNWKQVWNKKHIDDLTGLGPDEILDKLIKADGYDVGEELSIDDWKDYAYSVLNKLNIPEGGSVYEVGCGSGAFLYPFHLKGYKTSGIDFSASLIETIQKVIPEPAQFEINEAIHLDTVHKFDAVISNGIFFYFTNLGYARDVLTKMLEKSNGAVAILDLANNRFKEITEADRRKSIENFEEKYKGLDHLYFDKSWFLDFAEEHGCDIEIYNQQLEYGNSKYRFNCIIRKKK
jgi:SAM-dependent methyltransferase